MSFRKVQVLEFSVPIVPGTPAAYTLYTVPQGHRIMDVTTRITTVFDGTTPTLKVGDGTITDRFALTTEITTATVGLYNGKGTATTGFAATAGVVVTPAAGLPIVVTYAVAAAGTTGAARVLLTLMKIT